MSQPDAVREGWLTQDEWDRAERCHDITISAETRREAVVGINEVIRTEVAAEREACVKVCDDYGIDRFGNRSGGDDETAEGIAAAIRDRKMA